jgi:hypothetical protein
MGKDFRDKQNYKGVQNNFLIFFFGGGLFAVKVVFEKSRLRLNSSVRPSSLLLLSSRYPIEQRIL